MDAVNILTNIISGNEILAYFLIFVAIVLEGELVLVFSGIMAHLGAFDFTLLFLVAFAAAMAKTILGYKIGTLFFRHYPQSRIFSFLQKKVMFFLPRLKEKPFWSIFISKFIYGINHFTLILSGYMKTNFRTYFKAEFYSSVIWVLGLLLVGYFFSFAALSITRDIKKFFLLVISFFIIFILFEQIITFVYQLWKNLNGKN